MTAKRSGKRLTEGFVRGIDRPGTWGDGRGGYGLQIRAHRARSGHLTLSWKQKVRIGGKVTHLGIGRYPLVSLAEARAKAAEHAVTIHRGGDPRKAVRVAPSVSVAAPAPAPVAVTFADAFGQVMELNSLSASTIRTYRREFAGLPASFRRADVAGLTAGDVLEVLRPIHKTKPGKAASVQAVLSKVFGFAIGAGLRTDNPAARVLKALPKRRKVTHQKAVTVADAPVALAKLLRSGSTTLQRLEALSGALVAFTASRPGEVTGMRWSEVHAGTWTVPAERMKSGRSHRVPLSRAALDVLDAVAKLTGKRTGPVFVNSKGKPMDRNRPVQAMRRAGIAAVAHGWRSTFKGWGAEAGVPRDVLEACLAHVVQGVEAAYLRTDRLEIRREVMAAWAAHLEGAK